MPGSFSDNDRALLNRLDERVSSIKEDLADVKKNYTPITSFAPVQRFVYMILGIITSAFFTSVVYLIWKGGPFH